MEKSPRSPLYERIKRHVEAGTDAKGPHRCKGGDMPPTDAKGLKGGPRVGHPIGVLIRNRRTWLETAPRLRQKAIQGLLGRFRWCPTISIFNGFFTGRSQAVFSKIGSRKSENPPSPGVPSWGGPHRRKEGIWPPPSQKRDMAPTVDEAPRVWGGVRGCWELTPKFWKTCYDFLSTGFLSVWLRF